jgi:hypothetical protein
VRMPFDGKVILTTLALHPIPPCYILFILFVLSGSSSHSLFDILSVAVFHPFIGRIEFYHSTRPAPPPPSPILVRSFF